MPSSKYYCHDCAVRLAIVVPCDTSAINLTGSSYQLGKFMKHTMPSSYAGALTVFDRPDHSGLLDYTVAASVSGSAEVDSSGRINLVWYAGKHVGLAFQDGKFFCPDESIKVILYHGVTLIHYFPANYELHYISRCLECGRHIQM